MGGYFEGQEFVFLMLVTDKITLPVGFRFYIPDPELKKWKELIKAEKKAGITAKDRTKRPEINPEYPSKQMLGLDLLKKFSQNHPDITVQAVLADALYGNQKFIDEAAIVTHCEQVMSVGCLVENINAETLLDGISHIVNSDDPQKELHKFTNALKNSIPNRLSSKHLIGRDLGRMQPTVSFRYQKAA